MAFALLVGCVAGSKVKSVQQHDPILDQNGGPLVFVDVCNEIDAVGDNDYFAVSESKEVSHALGEGVEDYLNKNGVTVRATINPFVCGALDKPGNPPSKYAEKRGEDVAEAPRPYGISEEVNGDLEYINSLSTLSTYVQERNLLAAAKSYSKNKDAFKELKQIVSDEELAGACTVIREKSGAGSLLYVGMAGTKLTGGKKLAQGLASFTIGMITAIATAGLGTGYYYMYMPGRNVDWKYSNTGLINLESCKMTWTNWTGRRGNPLEPKEVASQDNMQALLRELVFKDIPIKTAAAN
jgi:hypothetical protein